MNYLVTALAMPVAPSEMYVKTHVLGRATISSTAEFNMADEFRHQPKTFSFFFFFFSAAPALAF